MITRQHVDEKIAYLKNLAKENGFSIRFIRHKRNIEDEFVIFIYNKSIKNDGYIIGYDGHWLAAEDSMCNFDKCVWTSSLFITDENYRKRICPDLYEKC